MTTARVVVESMFGNTEQVAKAVAQGLSATMETRLLYVAQAPDTLAPDVGLLIVGGPTHAFGLSRASTRTSAVDQGAHPPAGSDVGLREWLGTLQPGPTPAVAVAFDTRVRKRGVPGSAARGAQKRLKRLGFRVGPTPETFWVTGTPGPLAEGELVRARQWGEKVAADYLTGSRDRASS